MSVSATALTGALTESVSNLVNPSWLDATSYIKFLNCAFPGQWDRCAYEWYIARSFGGRGSDIVVRSRGTAVLAGIALSYRQVRLDEQAPVDVCALGAAATLPLERGRGHYAKLLDSVVERCRQSACTALVAFAARDNPSGRGLLRLGALAIPSYYLVSSLPASGAHSHTAGAACQIATATTPESIMAMLAHRTGARPDSKGPYARFHYAHRQDWMRQFIHRPNSVRAVRVNGDLLALVETVGSTDRLQWLSSDATASDLGALATASAREARTLFLYTLDPSQAMAANSAGFEIRHGYFLVLPLEPSGGRWHEFARAAWTVHSGDRV